MNLSPVVCVDDVDDDTHTNDDGVRRGGPLEVRAHTHATHTQTSTHNATLLHTRRTRIAQAACSQVRYSTRASQDERACTE
jgi:hypothetical protein